MLRLPSLQTVIYVRFKPQWLSVRIVRGGTIIGMFEDVAQVAARRHSDGKHEVIAIGQEAASAVSRGNGVVLCTGFHHPRVVFSNFADTLLVLEQFVRHAYGGKTPAFRPRPRILLQPMAPLEGGLADIEIRALRQIGLMINCRQAVVSEAAHELSDVELQAFLW